MPPLPSATLVSDTLVLDTPVLATALVFDIHLRQEGADADAYNGYGAYPYAGYGYAFQTIQKRMFGTIHHPPSPHPLLTEKF